MPSVWGKDTVSTENQDLVSGNQNILRVNDVNNNLEARPAIYAMNSNMNGNARALKVQGMAEIRGNIPGAPNGTTISLKVVHSQNPFLGTALVVEGVSKLDGLVTVEDDATFNGKIIVEDLDANAVALQTTNTSTDGDARALKVTGKTELDGLVIRHTQNCCKLNEINGYGIYIGDESPSGGVNIGRSGQDVYLNADTRVNGLVVIQNGSLESGNPEDLNLYLGTNPGFTENVEIGQNGSDVVVHGNLIVDAAQGNPGRMDAQVDGANPRNLEIGSQNASADIVLGRDGHEVRTVDDMKVGGDLNVGPTNDGGRINSGGTALTPQSLKIGTLTGTADVVLGRAGRTVDHSCQARLNSNGIVLNNAAAVGDIPTAGCGFIFNNGGHGGGPAIDFYTEGVLRGWVDSLGFHNV
ncbi:MAG: hypothetical protein V2A61_05610 [Calditrichota bacterium]